jgi:AcrR family transcriptional regulator
MARVVNQEIYQTKRNEILDVAQHLVMATKGFTEMSIQDILDELGISKGAFYHYFDSKHALLEALIERMIAEALPIMTAIVEDPDLAAPEKLDRYFHRIGRWKTDRKDYLMAFLRVWYTDENAITREKFRMASPERFGPLLNQIVQQGIDEGVFHTNYPDQAGRVIYSLLYEMGDQFAETLLSPVPDSESMVIAERRLAAFNEAVERVIGAPSGSLELMGPEIIRAWFEPQDELQVGIRESTG